MQAYPQNAENPHKPSVRADLCGISVAGMARIELARAESKSAVLPLDYIPLCGVGDGIRTHDLQCHKLTR